MTTGAGPVAHYCPECGTSFTAYQSQRATYCSRRCWHKALSTWDLDNPLKRQFVGKLRAEYVSLAAATPAIEVQYSALTTWLRHANHYLRAPNLKRIAEWLAISVTEAEVLQGGSAEDRQQAAAATASAARNMNKVRRTQAKRFKALRGQPKSQDHRDAISAALKARFEDPVTPRPTGAHKKTLRGRATSMKSALRQHRPELTTADLERELIARLTAPPYNVRTPREALALTAARYSSRKINWYRVIELRADDHAMTFEQTADLLLVEDAHSLLNGFHHFLDATTPR